MVANNPILHHRECRVPSLLEPSSGNVGSPTSLVQHLHPRDLVEAGNLVEHVAAEELDSGGDGFAAEFVRQHREPANAVVAVGVGEISSALEEAGNGGLAVAGGGFVELGLCGLGD